MNALTIRQPVLTPSTFGELVQFAKMASNSTLVPRDYAGKPENVMLAVQMGSELGLSPMQAIQNISVINGRPAVWGDAMLGLVRASPLCEDVIETVEGEGEARAATCTVKRRGATPVTVRFSAADAKRAGLLGKPGPWQQYPDRMMRMRARGFALRDAFPDVLRGLISGEEAADIPVVFNDVSVPREPIRQLTTSEAIGDSIPEHDEPPPSPDPLAKLRKNLARATERAHVVKIATVWRTLVETNEAEGVPFPELIVQAATDMLADRMADFPAPPPSVSDDGFGESELG